MGRARFGVRLTACGLGLLGALPGCGGEPGGPADPCAGVSCSLHGSCVTDGLAPFCSCDDGYHPEGLRCVLNDPIEPCAGVTCSDHGDCRVVTGRPRCDCDPGYESDEGGMLCLRIPDADVDREAGADDAGGPEEIAEAGEDTAGDEIADDGGFDDGDAAEGEALDGGSCSRADFAVQTECDEGFRCNLPWADTSGRPVCDLIGTGGSNEPCVEADPPAVTDTCAEFYTCVPNGFGTYCLRFCAEHADCVAAHGTPRSGCALEVAGGVRVCSTGCDLVSDDGCEPGQTCLPGGADSDGWYTNCTPAGTGLAGADCTVGGSGACAARHLCLTDGTPPDVVYVCSRLCGGDADCAAVGPLSRCLYSLIDLESGSSYPYPDVAVCSEGCDALAASGCAPGEACRYSTRFDPLASFCDAAGTGGQGISCSADTACLAGFSCGPGIAGRGNICRRHCRFPSGDPSCPPGTLCRAGGGSLPADFGFCVPAGCGNGIVETAEACDDGNIDNTDACLASCLAALCGDGYVWSGREACDGSSSRACTTACSSTGSQACAACAWETDCTAPAEACDGDDDDCDTVADNGFDCPAGSREACDAGGCAGNRTCSTACAWEGCTASAPAAPVPLSPSNGAATGSVHAPPAAATLRPEFRWLPPSTCLSLSYDLQVDDSCSTPGFGACAFPSPEIDAIGLTAAVHRPATDLDVAASAPAGRRYYWRVRACVGTACSSWSAVRYADVGREARDFDGDGYADVVVGAERQRHPGGTAAEAGTVFVYHGGPTGIPGAADLVLADPAARDFGAFGASLGVGDFNADGYADLVVGAPMQDAGAADEGNAFVYLGGASGLPAVPNATLDNPANDPGGNFGRSVASGGDLDGDGFADLVIGAPGQDAPEVDEGNAFVYLGGAAGIGTTPDVTLDDPADQVSAAFGWSVASAGDLDADGFADLVVGAPLQDASAADEGMAFVYLGSAGAVPVTPDFSLDPIRQAGGGFGWSVASAADVDGDGYPDLLVGAPLWDGVAPDEGMAFLYSGGLAGIASMPDLTLDNPLGQTSDRFGECVASAGDLDGDGFVELLVGVPGHDAPVLQEGSVMVWWSPDGPSAGRTLLLDNPAADPGGAFGTNVAGAGDIDGDGYADLVAGAPLQDAPTVDEGNAFVYLGSATGPPALPGTSLDNPTGEAAAGFGGTVL